MRACVCACTHPVYSARLPVNINHNRKTRPQSYLSLKSLPAIICRKKKSLPTQPPSGVSVEYPSPESSNKTSVLLTNRVRNLSRIRVITNQNNANINHLTTKAQMHEGTTMILLERIHADMIHPKIGFTNIKAEDICCPLGISG